MPVPLEQFVKHLEESGVLAGDTLKDFLPPHSEPRDAEELARELVRQKKLTKFQAEEVWRGKGRSLVLGNYVLLEKIGQGGMGAVYKAEHRRMHRIVAVKLLPTSMMRDAATIARFQREVEAAARINHPNIVTAFDAGHDGGVHFLVMEYVEGHDLSAMVKKNGPFPVDQAVNFILQAARGLQAAHADGIVHRDIKPANLLVNKEGTVKILDMGLARLSAEADAGRQADLTSTGNVMGTVDYMSPEQALDTKTADARADIYSLGCTLFYLLTGRAVYRGDTLMKKLLAHREQPIPSLRAVRPEASEQVEAVFGKMVAKTIADRYQTMAEVIADLERILAGKSLSFAVQSLFDSTTDEGLTNFLKEVAVSAPKPVPAGKSTAAHVGTSTKRLPLIGGGVLALGILALVIWQFRGRQPPAEADASVDGKKPSEAESLSANQPDPDETRGVNKAEPLAEADRLAEEKKVQERREAAGAAALPKIVARAAEPQIAFAEFAREVQAFNATHGGTQAANRAGELLTKLPSPLDRLDPQNLPPLCIDHWRVMGKSPPKELVGTLGDFRRKASGWLQAFAGTRDGRFVATAGQKIHLLDPRDGTIQKTIGEPGIVVAVSPDGKQLALAAWAENEARLWDVETGKATGSLLGHSAQIWCLAYTNDGKTVISASADETIRLWDASTREERRTLPGHVTFGAMCCLALSADGQALWATTTDDTVTSYALSSGESQRTLTHKKVRAVACSQDGRFVATSAADGIVKIWNAGSGNEAASFQSVSRMADWLVFDSTSHFLAVGETNAQHRTLPSFVRIFDVETWNLIVELTLEDQLGGLAFSQDGRLLFTNHWASMTLGVWDVKTGADPEPPSGHRGSVQSIAFSPIDCRVVTGGADNTVRVWNAVDGTELHLFDGFRRGVAGLAISPDGRFILADDRLATQNAAPASEYSLKLLNLATGAEVRRFEGEPLGSNALAFSPDGKLALSAGVSGFLWDVASGKSLARLEDRARSTVPINTAAISPDGRRAICAGDDGIIRMWDVKTGREVRRFEGHAGAIWTVAFTPDGARIVSSGADGYVRVWETGSGATGPPAFLSNTAPSVIAIDPTGRTVAAAALDGQIVFWDLPSGSKLGVIELADNLRRIAFAPDGRHLATANENGTVYILRVTELVKKAKVEQVPND